MSSYGWEGRLDGLRRELNDMERGAEGLERQLDRVEQRAFDAERQVRELLAENARLREELDNAYTDLGHAQ